MAPYPLRVELAAMISFGDEVEHHTGDGFRQFHPSNTVGLDVRLEFKGGGYCIVASIYRNMTYIAGLQVNWCYQSISATEENEKALKGTTLGATHCHRYV